MANLTNEEWGQRLEQVGAIWHHDGDLQRPFVQLTSGRISADFADLSYLVAQPWLLAIAAAQLAESVKAHLPNHNHKSLVVCGQMKGSVTLASRVAEELNAGFVWTNKIGEGPGKRMEVDERFVGMFEPDALVLLVEDVSTSALTSELSRDGLITFGLPNVSPILMTGVDRTGGSNNFGFSLLSLHQPNGFRTWERGKNPFTSDGLEILEPVHAKTKEGRRAMHRVLS